MMALSMELRGERKIGLRTGEGQKPTPEREAEIRRQQIKLARQALGANAQPSFQLSLWPLIIGRPGSFAGL